MQTQNKMQTAN